MTRPITWTIEIQFTEDEDKTRADAVLSGTSDRSSRVGAGTSQPDRSRHAERRRGDRRRSCAGRLVAPPAGPGRPPHRVLGGARDPAHPLITQDRSPERKDPARRPEWRR